MSIHYIYILRCPQTNEIRYVGCTEHPKIRERNHCRHAVSNPNTRVLMWVKSLREQGMRPVFEIIESSERAFQHEGDWVRTFRAQGCDLLNVVFNRE
jgi:predicted GIY-YIG superfamily endonuclease